MSPLIPQEIYLIERYTSADYFKMLRDAFAETVQAAEDALTEVMRTLPPDYRRHPRWQQPDITWGSVVLPNFRDTLQMVEGAYLALLRGDPSGIDRMPQQPRLATTSRQDRASAKPTRYGRSSNAWPTAAGACPTISICRAALNNFSPPRNRWKPSKKYGFISELKPTNFGDRDLSAVNADGILGNIIHVNSLLFENIPLDQAALPPQGSRQLTYQ